MTSPVRVRGNASAEELAALLAALGATVTRWSGQATEPDGGYPRWRRTRRQALAATEPGNWITEG